MYIVLVKRKQELQVKYHKVVQNYCSKFSLELKCCLLGECTWPPQTAQSVGGTFLVTLQLELVEWSSTRARL